MGRTRPVHCPQCGASLNPGEIACAACGYVLSLPQRARAISAASAARGTLPGAPRLRPEPLDGRTVPETGGLDGRTVPEAGPRALDGLAPTFVEGALDGLAPTFVEGALDGLAATLREGGWEAPRAAPPPVERLSALGLDASDLGRPARRAAGPTAPQASTPDPAPRQVPPAPSAPAALKPGAPNPGDMVEGYRIEREVGRGGMGRVYRAVHPVTGQAVALKMLLPELADDPRLKQRFVNEAKLLAQLEHPNLVPLLGFFETPRGAFIAMPFVEGITLDKMLRRQGRLDIPVALDLVGQLASGLDAMHARGIMHRDLKPSNVLVRSDGKVRITDFGIARAIGAERLTRQGMVVGTAEYLAPEQASGQSFDDVRSEIYSLAVLAYEMLTGQPPFRDPQAAKVLLKHVNRPPPPLRPQRPELPVGLEAAVLRGLAKRPEDRPANCLALYAALLRGLEAVPEPAPEPTSDPQAPAAEDPPPARAPRGGGGLLLLVQILIGAGLGAGLAWLAWQLLNPGG